MDHFPWAVVFLGIFATLVLDNFIRARDRHFNKLPGPTGLPLVGNLLSIPSTRPWETYARWKDIYGLSITLAMRFLFDLLS
jgi:hypothetical protein